MLTADDLQTMLYSVVVGAMSGFLYGLLFSESYTRVLFNGVTLLKSILFSCIRHGILGFAVIYLLHSTLLSSILIGISFLITFWVAVLYMVREESSE